jgi:hypothetical protein
LNCLVLGDDSAPEGQVLLSSKEFVSLRQLLQDCVSIRHFSYCLHRPFLVKFHSVSSYSFLREVEGEKEIGLYQYLSIYLENTGLF